MRKGAFLRLAVIASALVAAVAAAPAPAAQQNYSVHPLVSNGTVAGTTTDLGLVNAWGLTASSTSPWWVADNGSDLTTLYTGAGTKLALVVSVPGAPTGAVFNGTSGFVVAAGGASGPARFIFDTEEGTIRGWNPGVPPPPTSTVTEVGISRADVGAIYKGLAIAGSHLYAADFHNARVDVIDDTWHVVTEPGAFVDPSLPAGYAPFGIQSLGGNIFVTYAKQDAAAEDEVAGQGKGFVDEYDAAGHLIARVAQHGQLDAPWGIARAPASFGAFGGDLLVGNFGDGQINAYESQADGTYERVGGLRDSSGRQISIDGLWALEFGNGASAGPASTLFFTAGPNEEEDGLFGSITAD
jgi:uncharacterized protein (TIGR03118 family)